jgi:hypothetical protein
MGKETTIGTVFVGMRFTDAKDAAMAGVSKFLHTEA